METKKSKQEPRNLTRSEHDKIFEHIGKARVLALKMSKDKKYTAQARRKLASLERKLWALGDFGWLSVID